MSTTAPSAASEPELGRWLTRDLRAKGAPRSPSIPPASEPPPAAPPSEAELLAGWLLQDLTPKNSTIPRPPTVAPRAARDPLPPPPNVPFALAREGHSFDVPLAGASVAALSASLGGSSPGVSSSHAAPAAPRATFVAEKSSVVPPLAEPFEPTVATSFAPVVDSLAPQVVPPATASLPAVAPAALDEDDLAVLPGRRRAAGSERKKYAFVLLGVLCFAAAIGIGVRGRGGPDASESADSASPTDVAAVLLPPPPSEGELVAAPPELPAPAPRTANGADPSDETLDPLDPRNALGGGPSVRRYADVPSPTLSRLAREQRRLARERDDAARKPKANVPR